MIVVGDQARVARWTQRVAQPLVALRKHMVFLYNEVLPDHIFKAFGRRLQLAKHGKLYAPKSNNIGISQIELFSRRRALLMLEARFIEIDIV